MQDRDTGFNAPRMLGPSSTAWPAGARSLSSAAFLTRLLAGLLAVNLLVVGLVAWALAQSREQYEEAATVQASNLAQLLDHDIAAQIGAIDRTLQLGSQFVARQLAAGRLDTPALNAFLERQLFQLNVLNGLRYANSAGEFSHGAGTARLASASIAERAYFKRLRADPGLGLQISRPALGLLSGQWGLYLARAVRLPDGRFAGVIVASLPLQYLHQAFDRLALGSSGSIGLFDQQLRLIARQPGIPGEAAAAEGPAASPALRDSIAVQPRAGTYSAPSASDGLERRFAYRRVGELPLYVVVGLARADYLAPWRQEATKASGMALIILCLSLGLAWLVHRGWKLQARSVDALAQAYRTLDVEKQLNQTIVRSSPFAIYTRDRRGIVTGWNPAAEKLFGWPAAQVVGRPLPSVPPGQERDSEELRDRVLRGESIIDLELQGQKRDGTLFDLSTTLAPLRDPDGVVNGYLTIATDITERKAAEKRIEFLAYRDVLTGLPNRMLLQDRFEQAKGHADRSHTRMALLFLDLDNFKTINDSLGHAVGDALLKEIAARLGECVRETDTISRQGGDEFLIILPDLRGTEVITPVLIKIREKLQLPIHFEGHELSSAASIGVALYPDDGRDFETLLKKADTAMYRAKEAGRNQYRFFDEQMNIEAVEHLRVKSGLRRALAQDEFELHYQPQYDLASGRVVGAEALLRWRDPQRGLTEPAHFIALAEETGLIVAIGEWVMLQACRQAMAWRAAGLPPLLMAVNLSGVQFRRGDVPQSVIRALQATGFDPQRLELELTESILVRDTSLASVRQLKQLGVKLAIDDFGTGYSSLSYLKRFDIDKLKIDQSFVRELASDPDDVVIVRAIIQMAASLNLRTLAEGVEDAATLAQLREFGCNEAQGYHYARPMPAAEFAAFLAKGLNSQSDPEKVGMP